MSLEKLREKGFDIAFHGHAEAILEVDFSERFVKNKAREQK